MKNAALLFAFIILLASCKKDDDSNQNHDLSTFSGVISSGGEVPPVIRSEEETGSIDGTDIIDGEVWNCTTTTYSDMSAGGGNNGFPLFNPNASVVYPGSLIQGNSLKQATPNIIAVGRSGGTISYDLINGNLQSFFEVDEVKKSTIGNAMNQIIANSPPDLPANFTFNYSQVQSEEALALSLGIDYDGAYNDVSADFSFSSGESLNRILVELNQSFYTMSFDIPTSNAGFFAPEVTPEDLAPFTGPGNPACFISDVTYGRIYYMLIESSSSYTEMDAQINASFTGVTNSASADINASSLDELEELKIKVMAFGGDAASTLMTVGNSDLGELVDLLAESTTISTGVPISYVVRSVLTKQIVSVQLATEYDVTECTPANPGGMPPYTAHWTGNVLSAMGPVGAAFSREGTEFILISKTGDQWMRSDVGVLEGPFPISELGNTPPPFAGVGAACNIAGNQNADGWIQCVDMSGSLFTYLKPSGEWSTQVQPISNMAVGDNPFGLNGIGALVFRHKESSGPASRWVVNKDGTNFARYDNNPNSFGNVQNSANWAGGGMPFIVDKIGGGLGFYIGNFRYYLLFNSTGTRYCISGNVNGTGANEFVGPFDL